MSAVLTSIKSTALFKYLIQQTRSTIIWTRRWSSVLERQKFWLLSLLVNIFTSCFPCLRNTFSTRNHIGAMNGERSIDGTFFWSRINKRIVFFPVLSIPERQGDGSCLLPPWWRWPPWQPQWQKCLAACQQTLELRAFHPSLFWGHKNGFQLSNCFGAWPCKTHC